MTAAVRPDSLGSTRVIFRNTEFAPGFAMKAFLTSLAVVALGLATAADSRADVITYASSGTITLANGDSDPLGLGLGTSPFTISVNVDSAAPDTFSGSRSTYVGLLGGTVTLDGTPYSVIPGLGQVTF
ncbi:MAG: hypothetical protein ACRDD1_01180, partial [Planctomycetia bacterium]